MNLEIDDASVVRKTAVEAIFGGTIAAQALLEHDGDIRSIANRLRDETQTQLLNTNNEGGENSDGVRNEEDRNEGGGSIEKEMADVGQGNDDEENNSNRLDEITQVVNIENQQPPARRGGSKAVTRKALPTEIRASPKAAKGGRISLRVRDLTSTSPKNAKSPSSRPGKSKKARPIPDRVDASPVDRLIRNGPQEGGDQVPRCTETNRTDRGTQEDTNPNDAGVQRKATKKRMASSSREPAKRRKLRKETLNAYSNPRTEVRADDQPMERGQRRGRKGRRKRRSS